MKKLLLTLLTVVMSCGMSFAETTFTKVTSSDQIKAGGKYVILSKPVKSGAVQYGVFAMGAANSNKKSFAAYDVDGTTSTMEDSYSLDETQLSLLTLENEGADWYLSNGTEYLNCTANSTLKFDAKSANAKVTITPSDTKTTISFNTQISNKTASILFFCQNSSGAQGTKQFSAYTSAQKDIFLYVDEASLGGSVDPDPAEPGLYWPKYEYTVEYGQAFESPVLTKVPEDLVVMYVSGNDKVATVDENTGVVTITGVGTTTITAVDEDMVYEAAYTLTVTPINPVLTWSANEYTVTLGKEGEATYPTLTVQPEEVEALVEYSSSNEDVAMIDPTSGEIVTMSVGTTVITATVEAYENYAGATKSYTLTVSKEKPVLTWSAAEYAVTLGEEAELPTLTVEPAELAASVVYSSDNEEVAAIVDGVVTLKAAGNATITATLSESANYAAASASYALTVREAGYVEPDAKTVTIESFSSISGNLDDVISYEAAKGTASTNPAVNSEEIRVYQNGGLFTVRAKDGYTITEITLGSSMKTTVDYSIDGGTAVSGNAIAANGKLQVSDINAKNVVFTCKGTDKNSRLYVNYLSVTYITDGDPTKESAGLSFGETTTFEVMQGAEFTAPELQNPNGLEVVYASDNESVATVDPATGAVTIVGAGTATITAASEETDTYNAGSASYTITVKAAANTLAEYIEMAAENNAAAIMNCELIVTYANGAYVFVTDEHHTAYSLIYKFGLGYTKGNVIPAGWDAKTTIFNGLFEIVPVGDMPASVKTAEIGYETVDEFGLADINRVINLENVTVEGESFMTEAGQSFTVYNSFSQPTLSSGTYHMTGVVSYYESKVTSTANLKDANLQFRPIEYRLTADKAATMMVSHASADQKDNDDLYEAIEGDMHNANGSHVFVKFFNIPEGHTVYYRFVNMPAAANVMPLADEDEPAFVEYTGEPVEYNTNGSLEHYTQNAEGVKTEVKSISFSGVTGIEDIVVDGVDAEAVYYNLQGVRVEHPAKGAVYVRVAGNQAVKVLVK